MTPLSPVKLRLIALLLLIITTILWGSSFIITKIVTKSVPIFLYLGIRFTISLFGFIPFLIHIKKINRRVLSTGGLTGLIFFLGILFQTYGMQGISAGKTGFISGLSTVIVPFMTWFWIKKQIEKRIWVAVIFSVIGMAFLLLEGESGFIIGDVLVLMCAFFFALFIVLNDKYVKLVDIYLYTMIQLSIVALLSFVSSLLLNESFDFISADLNFWLIMLYLGIVVAALTFIFQNWSQKYVDSTHTAIILTLEPVFAVFFGVLIANETLSLLGWIGCSLIFSAILITSIKNKHKIVL